MSTDLDTLWNEHSETPLPDCCHEAEIDGIDLALLDTYTTGCVGTYLSRDTLDPDTLTILEASARQLRRVLPHLDGNATAYFQRLLDMSRAAIAAAREVHET